MQRTITIEGLLLGIGIGVLGTMMAPLVRQRFKPAAATVTEGLSAIGDGVKKWSTTAKEEVQDIVAEAQFERMRRAIDRDALQHPH